MHGDLYIRPKLPLVSASLGLSDWASDEFAAIIAVLIDAIEWIDLMEQR